MLVAGGKLLVDGSVDLANAIGISPLVIGLTVVAFGTSAPELAVGLKSALAAEPDILIGNAVGSNIFNFLVILGVAALISPLGVNRNLVKLDLPLYAAFSILLFVLSLDGQIGWVDGASFVLLLIMYTAYLVYESREARRDIQKEYEEEFREEQPPGLGWLKWVYIVVGLALLVLGADWVVENAVIMARFMGVSELVIGLTIVAGGTSLPEAATSVMAGWKGQPDIAIGNAVGSSIFNILSVIGIPAIIAGGIQVSGIALYIDIPVMIFVALLCLPVFFTGYRISRQEGLLFLAIYVFYVLYLLLKPHEGDAGIFFNTTVIGSIAVIIMLAILYLAYRQYYGNRHR